MPARLKGAEAQSRADASVRVPGRWQERRPWQAPTPGAHLLNPPAISLPDSDTGLGASGLPCPSLSRRAISLPSATPSPSASTVVSSLAWVSALADAMLGSAMCRP